MAAVKVHSSLLYEDLMQASFDPVCAADATVCGRCADAAVAAACNRAGAVACRQTRTMVGHRPNGTCSAPTYAVFPCADSLRAAQPKASQSEEIGSVQSADHED